MTSWPEHLRTEVKIELIEGQTEVTRGHSLKRYCFQLGWEFIDPLQFKKSNDNGGFGVNR